MNDKDVSISKYNISATTLIDFCSISKLPVKEADGKIASKGCNIFIGKQQITVATPAVTQIDIFLKLSIIQIKIEILEIKLKYKKSPMNCKNTNSKYFWLNIRTGSTKTKLPIIETNV